MPTTEYRLPTLADHLVAWLNLAAFRRMARGARAHSSGRFAQFAGPAYTAEVDR